VAEETRVSEPAISLIMPSYGRPELPRRLLEGLFRQEGAPPFEVLIVDDGSPEPVADGLGEFTAPPGVSVRVLRKPNGGPASARNLGMRESAADLLLFLDDDMVVPPDFVRRHFEAHQGRGPVAVVGDFDWRVAASPPSFAEWYQTRIRRNMEWWDEPQAAEAGPTLVPCESGMITSCNFSAPRALFAVVGEFDEGFAVGACEDQELTARLKLHGVPVFKLLGLDLVHQEAHATLEQLCRRQEKGALDTVRLVQRLRHYYGENTRMEVTNGPLRWGDPPGLAARKLLKAALGGPGGVAAVLRFTHWLERAAPTSPLLPRLYDLLVGIHLQRGWRAGLRKWPSVEPLPPPPGAVAEGAA
jgi:GT2 family glycosyltransferase